MQTKKCPNCQKHLDESQYYRRADGTLRSWCKICNRKFAKEYYARNPGLVGKKAKEWRLANADRIKSYRAANRQKHYRQELVRKYKVSVGWFDSQMERQKGKCLGCGIALSWSTKQTTPHVDHCHKSSIVRGILCNRCNSVIGLCGDSPSLLTALAEYLKTCHGI